jgi:nitroreductase
MELMDAIKSRKSVRKYDLSKPDWRKIVKAIDAVRFAPSAGNHYVTDFILVSDAKKIAKLAEASQQEFVGTAQYIVVAVSDDSKLVEYYGERGERYTAQQAGAAIQNFLLALTEQGLVTTWVGHFYDEQVKDILGISEKLRVEAIMPVGKETKIETKEQKKLKLDHILFFDKWGNKKMKGQTKMSRAAIYF